LYETTEYHTVIIKSNGTKKLRKERRIYINYYYEKEGRAGSFFSNAFVIAHTHEISFENKRTMKRFSIENIHSRQKHPDYYYKDVKRKNFANFITF
jgi:hypothetical protein